MKLFKTMLPAAAALVLCGCASDTAGRKAIDPVDFSNVLITDSFWAPRLDSHKSATIPVCIDQIEVQTGRMSNFDKVAAGEGEHKGFFFDDSDVYKALEGLAYSLIQHPDAELEAKCDDWIARMAAAQQENGYINTYFTLARPGEEWTDMDKHELYCAGHMIEAAIAYCQATGKRSLLNVAEKMVAHAMTVMGPEGKHWVPGHEEIELALVKLYRYTGEKKYLDFAGWLLEQRGHGYGVYGGSADPGDWWLTYYQDKVPVSELTDICGHAVRAMYLYCGMADVASYTGNESYLAALDRLWDDVVMRNMYITGGIGQSASNEGITEDYDLPNVDAYCETCASIGMILWNSRMNQMTADAKYADIMERTLYNAALAGMSISGDRFFYVNPLESRGDRQRKAWFGCACCPSNLCRFLPSLGGYIYGTSDKALWVNLYIGSTADIRLGGKNVKVVQKTDYPWNGKVSITLCDATRKDLMLRVPSWCRNISFSVNGKAVEPEIVNGYACLKGGFSKDSEIVVEMDMPVEIAAADPRVKEDEGKRAVCRGPIVYCAEEVDNPDFDDIRIDAPACCGAAEGKSCCKEAEGACCEGKTDCDRPCCAAARPACEICRKAAAPEAFETCFEADLLGGVTTITSADGLRLVPYYSWCNREKGRMKVWIDMEK